MRAGLLQFSPVRFDIDSNLTFIEKNLDGANADLIVLPEMVLAGYLFPSRPELEKYAETIPGPSTDRLEKICKRKNLHLICGIAEKSGAKIFNSAAVVGPGGLLGTYRKSHLFSEEKDLFEPGDTGLKLFDIGGVKVGVLVCFDWIFPESARTLTLMGADIIAHCANLVLPYAQKASITRCIENHIFWILANRTGEETEGKMHYHFTGQSRIVSPKGEVLAQCDGKTDCFCVVEIDPALARNKLVTERNDILADRRTDIYEL